MGDEQSQLAEQQHHDMENPSTEDDEYDELVSKVPALQKPPEPSAEEKLKQALAQIEALQNSLKEEQEAKQLEAIRVGQLQHEMEEREEEARRERIKAVQLEQKLEEERLAKEQEAQRMREAQEELKRQKEARDQRLAEMDAKVKKAKKRERVLRRRETERRAESQSPERGKKKPKAAKADEPAPSAMDDTPTASVVRAEPAPGSRSPSQVGSEASTGVHSRAQAEVRYFGKRGLSRERSKQRKIEAKHKAREEKARLKREADAAALKRKLKALKLQRRKSSRLSRRQMTEAQRRRQRTRSTEFVADSEAGDAPDGAGLMGRTRSESVDYQGGGLMGEPAPELAHLRMYHPDYDQNDEFKALAAPKRTFLRKKPRPGEKPEKPEVMTWDDDFYETLHPINEKHENFTFVIEDDFSMDRYMRMVLSTVLVWLQQTGVESVTMRDLDFYISLLPVQLENQFRVRVERVLNSNGLSLKLDEAQPFTVRAMAKIFQPVFIPTTEGGRTENVHRYSEYVGKDLNDRAVDPKHAEYTTEWRDALRTKQRMRIE